jgi:hypothetical protein
MSLSRVYIFVVLFLLAPGVAVGERSSAVTQSDRRRAAAVQHRYLKAHGQLERRLGRLQLLGTLYSALLPKTQSKNTVVRWLSDKTTERVHRRIAASTTAIGKLRGTLKTLGAELNEQEVIVVGGRFARGRKAYRPSELARAATDLMAEIKRVNGAVPWTSSLDRLQAFYGNVGATLEGKTIQGKGGVDDLVALLESPLMAPRLVARSGATADSPGAERLRQELELAARTARWASEKPQQRQVIDIDSSRPLPLEARYILAQQPELREVLRALKRRGVEVQLVKLKRTPPAVLESVNRIAVLSQENFLLNWLPQLIREGKEPHLTPTANGRLRAREAGRSGSMIDERATDAELRGILAGDLAQIKTILPEFLAFETSAADDLSLRQVAQLNAPLRKISREYAVRLLLFDNADDRTSEAQAVIKKLMVIGPAAHSLELAAHHFNLPLLSVLAKGAAGSADDVIGEYAEIKALLGSGFTMHEVAKRLKIALPVGAAATVGAFQVTRLLKAGHEMQAGALFGASAVALSLVTAVQSISMYHKAYNELLKEGKIQGKVHTLVNSAEFQAQLKRTERELRRLLEPDQRQRLLALVDAQLEKLETSGALTPGERARVLAELQDLDLRQIVAQVTAPSTLDRWWQGVRQDFANPARLGIFIGAMLSPLVGATAGALGGLNNGFVLAGVGSVESLAAGSTVLAARTINELRYEHMLRAGIRQAAKGRPALAR